MKRANGMRVCNRLALVIGLGAAGVMGACGGEGPDGADHPSAPPAATSSCVVTATGVQCPDRPPSGTQGTTGPGGHEGMPPSSGTTTTAALPRYMKQRWIWSAADGRTKLTYRFDGASYEGRQTGQIRHWHPAGTLGYTSNESFPYFLVAGDDSSFTFTSPDRRVQRFRILSYDGSSMLVDGGAGASNWYDCSAPSRWPNLIYASVCRN